MTDNLPLPSPDPNQAPSRERLQQVMPRSQQPFASQHYYPASPTDGIPQFQMFDPRGYRQVAMPPQPHSGDGRYAYHDPRISHPYFQPFDPRMIQAVHSSQKPQVQRKCNSSQIVNSGYSQCQNYKPERLCQEHYKFLRNQGAHQASHCEVVLLCGVATYRLASGSQT